MPVPRPATGASAMARRVAEDGPDGPGGHPGPWFAFDDFMLTTTTSSHPMPKKSDLIKLLGWGLASAGLFLATSGLLDARTRIDPGFAFLPLFYVPALTVISAWVLPFQSRLGLVTIGSVLWGFSLIFSWTPVEIQPVSSMVCVAPFLMAAVACLMRLLLGEAPLGVRAPVATLLLPILGFFLLLPTPVGMWFLIDWARRILENDLATNLMGFLMIELFFAPLALSLTPPGAWSADRE